jgi:hypothetical protein
VPQRYVGVLRDAVRVSVTHVPETKGEFVYSNVLAYPFEVLDQPSRAEIEEWQARTKDKVLA